MWLFPSRINPEKPMTFQGADWILRSAIKQAGLGTKGISSHSFRRTMITRLAEAGVGIKVIQRITGHESLVSVQRYIEVTDDQMKNAISLI
jgi:integrase/recombinase XerD